jgi:hypothetical protein
MIKFSLGYRYKVGPAEDCESDNKSVIQPIRPRYIRKIRISLDPSESKGVRFRDSPTVPNAEKHSKTILSKPYSPSIKKMAKTPDKIIKTESIIIANALLTEYS